MLTAEAKPQGGHDPPKGLERRSAAARERGNAARPGFKGGGAPREVHPPPARGWSSRAKGRTWSATGTAARVAVDGPKRIWAMKRIDFGPSDDLAVLVNLSAGTRTRSFRRCSAPRSDGSPSTWSMKRASSPSKHMAIEWWTRIRTRPGVRKQNPPCARPR